jgi:arsenate reductase (glutaredoxin)
MTALTIYHNPRCSKSRQTLDLINNHGATVEVVEYLKQPPTFKQIKQILTSLNLNAQGIMRKKEAEYKDSGLHNPSLSEDEQIQLMIENPKVMERPIVVKGDKAIIGRPPENVLDLF